MSAASGEHLSAVAIAELRAWDPPTTAQVALREAYLAVLLTSPEAVWRAHAPGHVTASAIMLDANSTHVLLVDHPRAGLWLPPGGHLEPEDVSLVAAALREVREETGLSDVVADPAPLLLDAHPFTCALGVPTRHLDVGFLIRTRPTADGTLPHVTISEESLDLRWWPVDALPERTTPRLAQEVAAALAL